MLLASDYSKNRGCRCVNGAHGPQRTAPGVKKCLEAPTMSPAPRERCHRHFLNLLNTDTFYSKPQTQSHASWLTTPTRQVPAGERAPLTHDRSSVAYPELGRRNEAAAVCVVSAPDLKHTGAAARVPSTNLGPTLLRPGLSSGPFTGCRSDCEEL